VSSYCSGVALDELAGLREADRERLSPEVETKAVATRAAFPRLAAVSAYLEPSHFDEVFAFGLELLLDAVERAPLESGGASGAKGRTRRT